MNRHCSITMNANYWSNENLSSEKRTPNKETKKQTKSTYIVEQSLILFKIIFLKINLIGFHTPPAISCPVIDRDVVDAKDAGQVYPPGGGSL